MSRPLSPLITGILFAVLWASASVAGKFGLFSVEPLVLFNLRFFGAGLVLLIYVYGVQRERLPRDREWGQLSMFGALNTTLYLGLFVLALNEVTPGITTLAVALNPLFISVFSAVWSKRKVVLREWIGIVLGIGGVFVAAYPHLETNYASIAGLVLLGLSQVTYSAGAVYYADVNWRLSRTSINAWQVFIGGLLMLPVTFLMHEKENTFDLRFFLSLIWLILPVSVVAVQLWLRLLKADAVRASMWLYLCPVFGFFYASVLVGEPLTVNTFVGTAFVLIALYVGQNKPGPAEKADLFHDRPKTGDELR
ncbi:MAG TPA: DMT family transporter [Chryseosolibacter sp.]|nr:DMT family transporter [Chryseosolibacter sp.]